MDSRVIRALTPSIMILIVINWATLTRLNYRYSSHWFKVHYFIFQCVIIILPKKKFHPCIMVSKLTNKSNMWTKFNIWCLSWKHLTLTITISSTSKYTRIMIVTICWCLCCIFWHILVCIWPGILLLICH
jgi:hypothetical protein